MLILPSVVRTARGTFPGHAHFCAWFSGSAWRCSYFIVNLPRIGNSQRSLPAHSSLTDWIPMGFCMHRFERKVWNSVSTEAPALVKTWFLGMSRVAFSWNSWILKGSLLEMLLKVTPPVLERLPNSCFSQNLKGRSGKAQINGCRNFILLWHWAAFLNISTLKEKNIHSLQALQKMTSNKHTWGREEEISAP